MAKYIVPVRVFYNVTVEAQTAEKARLMVAGEDETCSNWEYAGQTIDDPYLHPDSKEGQQPSAAPRSPPSRTRLMGGCTAATATPARPKTS